MHTSILARCGSHSTFRLELVANDDCFLPVAHRAGSTLLFGITSWWAEAKAGNLHTSRLRELPKKRRSVTLPQLPYDVSFTSTIALGWPELSSSSSEQSHPIRIHSRWCVRIPWQLRQTRSHFAISACMKGRFISFPARLPTLNFLSPLPGTWSHSIR